MFGIFNRFTSIESIIQILIALPAVILSLSTHEFAHAFVSYKQGDPTAKNMGRLTLNPLTHLDIIGFLSLLLFSFGWAKPVPIQPSYYKNPLKGTMYTSLAGPLSNFALAIVSIIVFFIFTLLTPTEYLIAIIYGSISTLSGIRLLLFIVYQVILSFISINLLLGIFNLIPIPPLDGSKILMGFTSYKVAAFIHRIEPFGWVIIIVLSMTGILNVIFTPVFYLSYIFRLENFISFL